MQDIRTFQLSRMIYIRGKDFNAFLSNVIARLGLPVIGYRNNIKECVLHLDYDSTDVVEV